MSWIIATILGTYIIIAEFIRVPRIFYVDFLRGVSISFFFVYVLVPISLPLTDANTHRFYWIEWINYRDSTLAGLAQALALISYFLIRFGFYIGYRVSWFKKLASVSSGLLITVSFRMWFWLATILGVLSALFLLMYSHRRGAGLGYLLATAGQVRVGQYVPGVEEASFAFLTYSMIGIFSSFIYLGLLQVVESQKLRPMGLYLLRLAFIATLVLSFVVLWIRAGRLHLLNYLLVLALWSMRGKRLLPKASGVLAMMLGISVVYVGKYMLGVAQSLDDSVGFGSVFSVLVSELSFPYLSLVNALSTEFAYRYFVDVPLAVIYTIGVPFYVLVVGSPPGDLPISIAKINTMNILGTVDLGEIPVDLVSFGYLSAGVFGVSVTSFLFGGMLAFFERAFPKTLLGVPGVLRTAWIIFSATVCLLYADPVNVLRDGLYIIGPTMMALGTAWVLQSSKNGRR